jgi:hypothetical protein
MRCLAALQPTIRSALSRDTATDYPLCSVLILQPTIRSTLSVDSTTDNPIYRLSMLEPRERIATLQPSIRSALLCPLLLHATIQSTNCRCYNQISALLCLATLQRAIRSPLLWRVSLQLAMRSPLPILPVDSKTDYTLSSTCRYYNRLSALLCLASLVTLQLTICSTLPVDVQRCSTLSGDNTSDYLLYSICRYVRRWSRLGASRRSLPAASRRSRRAVSCLRSRRWVSRRS